jgi:hypothetical protein
VSGDQKEGSWLFVAGAGGFGGMLNPRSLAGTRERIKKGQALFVGPGQE